MQNFDNLIKPALLKEHPNMAKDGADVFRRKWEVSGGPDLISYVLGLLFP